MSRVVVRNLPKHITKERFQKIFEEYGNVTDVKLLYTQKGVFRRMGFIGFMNEEDAVNSIENLNGTYVDTSKLQVEEAKPIGDESLQRPWSKYSKGSSAFSEKMGDKRRRENMILRFKSSNNDHLNQEEKKKKKKNNISTQKMILDACGIDLKDSEKLREFMELNNMDAEFETSEQDKNEDTKIEETDESTRKPHTVKLSNLRIGTTINRILKFFDKLSVIDVRIIPPTPRKKTVIAFVDFKDYCHVEEALKMSGEILKGNNVRIVLDDNTSNSTNIDKRFSKTETNIESSIIDTGRIFVRNLPFGVEEEEIRKLFEAFGPVVEVTMPFDKKTNETTGFAYVSFMLPEHALIAFNSLDKSIFKGRILSLHPSLPKYVENIEETGIFKVDKLSRMKANAHLNVKSWNTFFVNQNAVANIISRNLNINKEDLILNSENPAVNIATAETWVVNEIKSFLEKNGVNLDAFKKENYKKSDRIILMKNIPDGISSHELRIFLNEKLVDSNDVSEELEDKIPNIILPPQAALTAILEFDNSHSAKRAFKKLAFTRFKFTPVYLEWAPDDTFSTNDSNNTNGKVHTEPNIKEECKQINKKRGVLFIKNMNIKTTEETIKEKFETVGAIQDVTIARKKVFTKSTKLFSLESLGYGFVEFSNPKHAKEALKDMQGCTIDGSVIELKLSEKTSNNLPGTLQTSSMINNNNNNENSLNGSIDPEKCKLLVRNVAFEATENELRDLFRAYGKIKSIRLPRKAGDDSHVNKHRGFAFVDFVTHDDAKRCMEALHYSTHLYGRRLNIEWAEDSNSISFLRKRAAPHQPSIVTGKRMIENVSETLQQL